MCAAIRASEKRPVSNYRTSARDVRRIFPDSPRKSSLAALAKTHRLIEVRREEELADVVLATRYAFAYARYQNVFCGELVSKRRGLLQNLFFQTGSQMMAVDVKGEIDSRVASQSLSSIHISCLAPWFVSTLVRTGSS